ncbi:hypothetical protein [Legionella lansingensis]|uniref:Uncharacterized protein n=1 Tax=Legionella lansingensis TaxID=45067 RepID=A0A0W0W0U7_9GAMM|nr:hypothetical protein [Legionella lansingensis]KTD26148.1 hypothetical protein Llan_0043 [Legionella lansingensis]
MPKFLENNTNVVLLDVQRGKRYVGEPSVLLPQSAQKGNTCALYAFNPLRFRFGKKYSEDSRERHIELVFSEYRKGLNKIDYDVANTYKELLEEIKDFLNRSSADNTQITKEDVEKFVANLDANLEEIKGLSGDTSGLKNQIIRYMQICREFTSEECQDEDFEEFISQKEHIDHIKLAQKTINLLSSITGFGAQEVFDKHVSEHIKSVINTSGNSYGETLQLTLGNPQFMAPLYHQAVINLAASCYQLEGSEWHPTMPIEALMDTLREFGPLIIYTEPCVLFDIKNCQIVKDTERYQIYSNLVTDQPGNDGSHSLLIIGVENCNGSHFVYLSDPNVPAQLTGPSPIYKIPYDELLSKILNVYGVSLQEEADKINGPFAFQAKKGNFDKIYDFVNGAQLYPETTNSKKNKYSNDVTTAIQPAAAPPDEKSSKIF